MNRYVIIDDGDGGMHAFTCLLTCSVTKLVAEEDAAEIDVCVVRFIVGNQLVGETINIHAGYNIRVCHPDGTLIQEWRGSPMPDHDELTAYVSAPEEMVRSAVLLASNLLDRKIANNETWLHDDPRRQLADAITDEQWRRHTGHVPNTGDES